MKFKAWEDQERTWNWAPLRQRARYESVPNTGWWTPAEGRNQDEAFIRNENRHWLQLNARQVRTMKLLCLSFFLPFFLRIIY